MHKVKEAPSHRRKLRTTESSGEMGVFGWTCVVIPLVATLVAGCNNTRPLLKRSDFYLACAEWASTDDAFSFESGPVLQDKLVGNSGGRSADQLHFTLEVKASIHGTVLITLDDKELIVTVDERIP